MVYLAVLTLYFWIALYQFRCPGSRRRQSMCQADIIATGSHLLIYLPWACFCHATTTTNPCCCTRNSGRNCRQMLPPASECANCQKLKKRKSDTCGIRTHAGRPHRFSRPTARPECHCSTRSNTTRTAGPMPTRQQATQEKQIGHGNALHQCSFKTIITCRRPFLVLLNV